MKARPCATIWRNEAHASLLACSSRADEAPEYCPSIYNSASISLCHSLRSRTAPTKMVWECTGMTCVISQSKLASALGSAGAPVTSGIQAHCSNLRPRNSGRLNRCASSISLELKTLAQKTFARWITSWLLESRLTQTSKRRLRLGADRADRCRDQTMRIIALDRGDDRNSGGQPPHPAFEQRTIDHGR